MPNKVLLNGPGTQFVDADGNPIVAGSIKAYINGTDTLSSIYSNASGTARANPYTFGSGFDKIYIDTDHAYKIELYDQDDALIVTYNDVSATPDFSSTVTIGDIIFADNHGILDSNGNKVAVVQKVTSPVNYFKVLNAATGNKPTLQAVGTDTNVGFIITGQGSPSTYQLGSTTFPYSDNSVNGQVPVTNGSNTVTWTSLSSVVAPRHYLGGFKPTYNSSTSITISAGTCTSSDNSIVINMASAMTKTINVGWAQGTNQGGLFSGVVLASGITLHVFAITNGTSVDIGIDDNITADNIPSGWTAYRRIRSFKANTSGLLDSFICHGTYTEFTAPVAPVTGTLATVPSGTLSTLNVPADIIVNAKLTVSVENASGANQQLMIHNPAITVTISSFFSGPANGAFSLGVGSAITICNCSEINVLTDTSSRIKQTSLTNSASVYFQIYVLGYDDVTLQEGT